MSETQAAPAPAGEMTRYEGRYIPYSGGCMGWYENSGVLKSEVPNNYLFYTALDNDLVRARKFERSGVKANRRRSDRRSPQPELDVSLMWGTQSKPSKCIDISLHGMRVHIADEQVGLRKDDRIKCQIQDKAGGEPLQLDCTVTWAEKTGKAHVVWNCGLAFITLTPGQLSRLKQLTGQSA